MIRAQKEAAVRLVKVMREHTFGLSDSLIKDNMELTRANLGAIKIDVVELEKLLQ